MFEFKVPVIGFVAYSGTGKTTLLTRLIPLLREEGLRVGVIKHAHHAFEIDTPGKDSYELQRAGAGIVYDSRPDREFDEVEGKLAALFSAFRLMEELEDSHVPARG